MDPLSITAGVLTLLTVSVKVSVLLKQFRDEVDIVDATLSGLLGDIANFQQVLESMRDTFDQDEIKANIQVTGHAGGHWKNLARSVDDGTRTLQQLVVLLESINKTTSFLDGPRKQLRLKSAMEQIGTFRDQIQSYRAALQLSLSTIILWNQVTFQKSSEGLPEKIMPTLDKLYDEFRSLGISLNAKIENLRTSLTLRNEEGCNELDAMSNLRECVRSAADVVSSASSTLTVDLVDKSSVRHGSDFGEIFMQGSNEPMMRWMSSNTVYEFEELTPQLDPSESSTVGVTAEYQSDSDSDLETEMMKALFESAMRLKDAGDLVGAERKFRNCLTRTSMTASTASLTSLKRAAAGGISRLKILELLLDTYCMLEAWSKAKQVMVEKLSLTHKQVGTRDELYLWDTLKLAELMAKCKEWDSAHLQGRRSLRGFRRLGEESCRGYEQCVVFLIKLCHEEGKIDEEEAYTDLLESHHAKMKAKSASPPANEKSSTMAQVQSEYDPDDMRGKDSMGISKSAEDLSSGPGAMESQHEQGAAQQVQIEDSGGSSIPKDTKALPKDVEEISPSESLPTVRLPVSTLITKAQGEGANSVFDENVEIKVDSITPSPSSTEWQDHVKLAQFMSDLYLSGPVHTSLQTERSSQVSRLDLLTTYCQLTHGNVPRFKVTLFEGRWDCHIELGDMERQQVSSCSTELLAREAAVDEACRHLIPLSTQERLVSGEKLRDPFSDKEVLSPVSILEKSRMDVPVREWFDAGLVRMKQRCEEPQVVGIAEDATSYVQDVSHPPLRRSVSDRGFSHDVPLSATSPNMVLRNVSVEPRIHSSRISGTSRRAI
ncbi:hypothetical protein BKA63DRAFT_313970 [Paraphoma chrysanthemicola]|nr:hypothetical protein BKA63DRAFT_313970 [Paraphoma chrysanthemicola]